MPAAISYPGVYIEEIPSGVRTITGVPTSITAFVGRALEEPTDEPVKVNSSADYERTFGGLWRDQHVSYAVRRFLSQRRQPGVDRARWPIRAGPATRSRSGVDDRTSGAPIALASWGKKLRQRGRGILEAPHVWI